jgi:hypothetical protein
MKKSHAILCILSTAALVGLAAGASHAQLLQVDFGTQDVSAMNTGNSPNRVAAGYQDFSYGPEMDFGGGTDAAIKLPPSTLSQTYGAIGVTVFDPHPASNGLYFGDEGTVNSGALSEVADDYVNPSGPELHLTLSGLAAGLYGMTTVHHRPLGASVNSINGIAVDTGSGPQSVASNVPISFGLTPPSISKVSFQFTADGTNDVEVAFQGGMFPAPLNGFILIPIPEPASAALLAVGGGLIAAACLRRKLRSRRGH